MDGWIWRLLLSGPLSVFSSIIKARCRSDSSLGIVLSRGMVANALAVDVEKDGDIDLIAGNWGRNTRYQSLMQGEEGLRLYTADGNQMAS